MSIKTLFIYVFALSVLLCTVEMECYAKSSTIMGSRYPNEQGFPGAWEKQTDSQLADYIYDCSTASSYTSFNWYGASTTEENIYDAAWGVDHVDSISFYIGHGKNRTIWWNGEIHWDMQADDGVWVADDWIHPHSSCQNVKFAFLWSCHLGEVIGGTHFWTGPYGMPHAWLHTTSLSTDGYANPDNTGFTFLGFSNYAPGLTATVGGKYRAGYDFAGYFYQRALLDGFSIIESLDLAARYTWDRYNPNYHFSDSVFYQGYLVEGENGKMEVYGDGNLEIGSASSTPPLPPPPNPPRPPSTCPTLFVWNGSNFCYESLLDIHAESDITVQHRIGQILVRDGRTYKLRLWELDNFTSHINQVKLYAVDENELWHLSPLMTANHNEFGDVTLELRLDDSKRIDLTPTRIIDLEFSSTIPYNRILYFIFEINGYNYKPRPT